MSVKTPQDPGNDASALMERFFWVYTDFYKWSILSQHGKVALLLNVFADQRFERRQEFIFRTKEAVRMATAIEYYIEKFMSVMHLTLEGDPTAHENGAVERADQPQSPMSLRNAGIFGWHVLAPHTSASGCDLHHSSRRHVRRQAKIGTSKKTTTPGRATRRRSPRGKTICLGSTTLLKRSRARAPTRDFLNSHR